MHAVELRARIARFPRSPAPLASDDASMFTDGKLTAAAVLIPIILGPQPAILLTKRSARMAKHAGQVSFPGGRIDPKDAHAEAAALREAEEEIALAPHHVELAGRLGDYVTGTGYAITPILGFIASGLAFRPNPREVDAVFEFSLATLLDPDAPTRQRHFTHNLWRDYWVWPHPEHFIWGATAGILVHLAALLRDPA
ncbi:MAG: CoA pyrophosphatase [Acetobacteraceae bacterium]|nr:CoA pyrophosphatase [Acetobacteraceae bacterium]